jgi:hypothetical protein
LTKINKKVKRKYKFNQYRKEGESMNGYADFKKKIGLKDQEVENLTGYTKAGL